MNKQAVIILHEIYGVNGFIKNVCEKMRRAGFDVYCPNLIGKDAFAYEDSSKAYEWFISKVGFEIYKKIKDTVHELKKSYEKVFIVGFSVGATIAWRCCETQLCDGIIGCYGSRIRDYSDLTPACPTLLIFAKKDSFDVNYLVSKLEGKEHLEIVQVDARHGFMDMFSNHFNVLQSKYAELRINEFLSAHIL